MSDEKKAENTGEKLQGSMKEAAGKLTGDQQTQSEGQAQKSKAEAKDKVENAKDTAKGAVKGLKNDEG